MTTPTDDRRDLLTVVAHLRAEPDREQDPRDALTALVVTSMEGGPADDGLPDLAAPHLEQLAGVMDHLREGVRP